MEFQPPSISQMNANATHIPIFSALLTKTGGPVVEFGAGHYSTPMLYYVAKTTGRLVLTVETSQEWYNYFTENFKNEHHKYLCTANLLITRVFPGSRRWGKEKWDIAFIDCGPDPDRKRCIEMMRDRAKYILVHDAEPAAGVYDWGVIFDSFPNKFYWDFYGNGTIVLSMEEDCSWLS